MGASSRAPARRAKADPLPAMSGADPQMSELDTIIYALQCVSERMFKPKRAYTFFIKDVMKGSGEDRQCKSLKEAAAKWAEMGAAQKKPFLKQEEEEKARAAKIQEEWEALTRKHADKLLEAAEAEEAASNREKKRYIAKNKADKKKEKAKKTMDVKQKKEQKLARQEAAKKQAEREARQSAQAVRGRGRPQKTTDKARAVSATPGGRPAKGLAQQMESMSVGLDPFEWEVRESRRRPGFLYYFNLLDGKSQSARPPPPRPAKKARQY